MLSVIINLVIYTVKSKVVSHCQVIIVQKLNAVMYPFLAHLWGAYAIPMALSVVRRVSSLSTITTRNN